MADEEKNQKLTEEEADKRMNALTVVVLVVIATAFVSVFVSGL